MRTHIAQTAQTWFYHLRRLRQIRRLLGCDVARTVVTAIVLSRIDYCNAVLSGLPQSTIAPLQQVLNVAAHVVCGLCHRTMSLMHWSDSTGYQSQHVSSSSSVKSVLRRITSLTCCNLSQLSTAMSPYIQSTTTTYSYSTVVSISVNVLFILQLLERGIVCHLTWRTQILSKRSKRL